MKNSVMNLENVGGYTLKNLNKINVLLGKNGCGKSILLQDVEKDLLEKDNRFGFARYLTPERGGELIHDPSVENNIINNISWLQNDRRRNQSANFKKQSLSQYRELETMVLREIDGDKRDDHNYTFDSYVAGINALLDNIEIKREGTAFNIYKKSTNILLSAHKISSGESELISLAVELLIFSKKCIQGKNNMLFFDEPDVHLHSDLQRKLMQFLIKLVEEYNFTALIATHSTAILRSLVSYENTNIAFMAFGQKEIEFKSISEVYRKILPMLGAHPLSNVFNEYPVLLVEGEDDERMWQRAVRSSDGRIRLYPCSVDGKDNMNDFETEIQNVIKAVYDNAKGYSIRDQDEISTSIDDLQYVVRLRLCCRDIENLLLTDEVLASLGTNWQDLKTKICSWIDVNATHTHFAKMKEFKEKGFDRKNYDIKELRNDIMGIIGSSKPWEVAVGQTVAGLMWDDATQYDRDGSIFSFLGEKAVRNLLPKIK